MKTEVKTLSISELVALYQFVSSKPFTANQQAKKIIKERLGEIEDELMDRAFGLNPYEIKCGAVQQVEKGIVVVKYEGEDPMKVVNSDAFKAININTINTHELPAQTSNINTTTDGGSKA